MTNAEASHTRRPKGGVSPSVHASYYQLMKSTGSTTCCPTKRLVTLDLLMNLVLGMRPE